MPKAIGRLHVLTDTVLQRHFSHVELAELALAGGADVIQFRQKSGSTRAMIDEARAMRALCARAGAPLIVNDRLDVALAAGADGVHLGQDDFPLELARAILGPEKIIGGSAATTAEARLCLAQGADYVGFGPVFPTGSKADAGPVSGLAVLAVVAREIPLPIIAIGGVGPANAAAVRAAGAHGLAVISAVCCRSDPAAAARELGMAWDQAG
jgi:thiamine-phosphate pyrophosphorylase